MKTALQFIYFLLLCGCASQSPVAKAHAKIAHKKAVSLSNTNGLPIPKVSESLAAITGADATEVPIQSIQTSFTNWNGTDITAVYTSANGAVRFAAIRAPVVSFHRTLPNLQTGDYGITDITQDVNGEVWVTMAEQAWSTVQGESDEMSQMYQWTLYGSPDLTDWIQLDCKKQETTGGLTPFSPFTITFDAGLVQYAGLMAFRVIKQ